MMAMMAVLLASISVLPGGPGVVLGQEGHGAVWQCCHSYVCIACLGLVGWFLCRMLVVCSVYMSGEALLCASPRLLLCLLGGCKC